MKKKRFIKDMNEVTCYVANWGRIHQAEKTASAKDTDHVADHALIT